MLSSMSNMMARPFQLKNRRDELAKLQRDIDDTKANLTNLRTSPAGSVAPSQIKAAEDAVDAAEQAKKDEQAKYSNEDKGKRGLSTINIEKLVDALEKASAAANQKLVDAITAASSEGINALKSNLGYTVGGSRKRRHKKSHKTRKSHKKKRKTKSRRHHSKRHRLKRHRLKRYRSRRR